MLVREAATRPGSRTRKVTAQDMVAAAKQHITEVNVNAKQLIAEGNIVLSIPAKKANMPQATLTTPMLLPRGVLEFKIGNLPELADKSKPVLIYCRTGGRSAMAAQTMQALGYTQCPVHGGWF